MPYIIPLDFTYQNEIKRNTLALYGYRECWARDRSFCLSTEVSIGLVWFRKDRRKRAENRTMTENNTKKSYHCKLLAFSFLTLKKDGGKKNIKRICQRKIIVCQYLNKNRIYT